MTTHEERIKHWEEDARSDYLGVGMYRILHSEICGARILMRAPRDGDEAMRKELEETKAKLAKATAFAMQPILCCVCAKPVLDAQTKPRKDYFAEACRLVNSAPKDRDGATAVRLLSLIVELLAEMAEGKR
jgi:hypothetical protein